MRVTRPWGWYLTLIQTSFFWIKILRVTGRTSLQTHAHRAEMYIGSDFGFIYPDYPHRMNKGWYLELAMGRPDEADIRRIEDDYGRV